MPGAEHAPFSTRGGTELWSGLAPGDAVILVKLAPDGSEAARYPGTVIARHDPETWVVVEAVWTYRQIEVAGLTFSPGDVLAEWFSPHHDFNVFAVHSPSGRFKGWYANVTYPARLNAQTSPPTLVWHDLYIDLIVLPDGASVIADEDELAESGIEQNDPPLHSRILRARDELLRRLEHRLPPFKDWPRTGESCPARRERSRKSEP
jgi:protein associated with RNAse G/E